MFNSKYGVQPYNIDWNELSNQMTSPSGMLKQINDEQANKQQMLQNYAIATQDDNATYFQTREEMSDLIKNPYQKTKQDLRQEALREASIRQRNRLEDTPYETGKQIADRVKGLTEEEVLANSEARKALRLLPEQERLDNYRRWKQGDPNTEPDYELDDLILNGSNKDVEIQLIDSPLIKKFVQDRKQERQAHLVTMGLGDNSILDSLKPNNILASSLSGIGETAQAISSLYHMATKEDEDRLNAMTNKDSVANTLFNWADALKSDSAKISDLKSNSLSKLSDQVYQQSLLDSLQKGVDRNKAEMQANIDSLTYYVSNALNNKQSIAMEGLELIPDIITALFTGGTSAAILKGGKKALVNKVEKEIKHKLAMQSAKLDNIAVKHASEETINKAKEKLLKYHENILNYKKNVTSKQLDNFIKPIVSGSVMAQQGLSSGIQNAVSSYTDAAEAIMDMDTDTVANSINGQKLKEQHPEYTNKDIQRKLADIAGSDAYKNTAISAGIAGVLGGFAEGKLVNKLFLGNAKGGFKDYASSIGLNASEEYFTEADSKENANIAINKTLGSKYIDEKRGVREAGIQGAISSGLVTGITNTPELFSKKQQESTHNTENITNQTPNIDANNESVTEQETNINNSQESSKESSNKELNEVSGEMLVNELVSNIQSQEDPEYINKLGSTLVTQFGAKEDDYIFTGSEGQKEFNRFVDDIASDKFGKFDKDTLDFFNSYKFAEQAKITPSLFKIDSNKKILSDAIKNKEKTIKLTNTDGVQVSVPLTAINSLFKNELNKIDFTPQLGITSKDNKKILQSKVNEIKELQSILNNTDSNKYLNKFLSTSLNEANKLISNKNLNNESIIAFITSLFGGKTITPKGKKKIDKGLLYYVSKRITSDLNQEDKRRLTSFLESQDNKLAALQNKANQIRQIMREKGLQEQEAIKYLKNSNDYHVIYSVGNKNNILTNLDGKPMEYSSIRALDLYAETFKNTLDVSRALGIETLFSNKDTLTTDVEDIEDLDIDSDNSIVIDDIEEKRNEDENTSEFAVNKVTSKLNIPRDSVVIATTDKDIKTVKDMKGAMFVTESSDSTLVGKILIDPEIVQNPELLEFRVAHEEAHLQLDRLKKKYPEKYKNLMDYISTLDTAQKLQDTKKNTEYVNSTGYFEFGSQARIEEVFAEAYSLAKTGNEKLFKENNGISLSLSKTNKNLRDLFANKNKPSLEEIVQSVAKHGMDFNFNTSHISIDRTPINEELTIEEVPEFLEDTDITGIILSYWNKVLGLPIKEQLSAVLNPSLYLSHDSIGYGSLVDSMHYDLSGNIIKEFLKYKQHILSNVNIEQTTDLIKTSEHTLMESTPLQLNINSTKEQAEILHNKLIEFGRFLITTKDNIIKNGLMAYLANKPFILDSLISHLESEASRGNITPELVEDIVNAIQEEDTPISHALNALKSNLELDENLYQESGNGKYTMLSSVGSKYFQNNIRKPIYNLLNKDKAIKPYTVSISTESYFDNSTSLEIIMNQYVNNLSEEDLININKKYEGNTLAKGSSEISIKNKTYTIPNSILLMFTDAGIDLLGDVSLEDLIKPSSTHAKFWNDNFELSLELVKDNITVDEFIEQTGLEKSVQIGQAITAVKAALAETIDYYNEYSPSVLEGISSGSKVDFGSLALMTTIDRGDSYHINIPKELIILTALSTIEAADEVLNTGYSASTEEFLENQGSISIYDNSGKKYEGSDVSNIGIGLPNIELKLGQSIRHNTKSKLNKENSAIHSGISHTIALQAINIANGMNLVKPVIVKINEGKESKAKQYTYLKYNFNAESDYSQNTLDLNGYLRSTYDTDNPTLNKILPVSIKDTNQAIYKDSDKKRIKPLAQDQNTEFTEGHNSTYKKELEYLNNQSYKLDYTFYDTLKNLGNNVITLLGGMPEDKHNSNESNFSNKSINESIKRNFDYIDNFIKTVEHLFKDDNVSLEEAVSNSSISMRHQVTQNTRVMNKGQINPQNSKIDRILFNLQTENKPFIKEHGSLPDIIRNSSNELSVMFALSVAQALGVKVEKLSFAHIADNLENILNDTDTKQLLEDVSDVLKGNKKLSKDLAIKFSKTYGKDSPRVLKTLYTLNQYNSTQVGDNFVSTLLIETDGMSNGSQNIILQFSTTLSGSMLTNLQRVGHVSFDMISRYVDEQHNQGNNISIEDAISNLRAAQELFDKDSKQLNVKDSYEAVAHQLAIKVQKSLGKLKEYLDSDIFSDLEGIENISSFKDIINHPELVNHIVELISKYNNSIINKRNAHKSNYENLKGLGSDIEENYSIDDLTNELKTYTDVLNAINSIQLLSLYVDDIDKLYNVDLSSGSIDNDGNLYEDLFINISRSFTKKGVIPTNYGGKLDGITNQVVKDIKKDLYKLADKIIHLSISKDSKDREEMLKLAERFKSILKTTIGYNIKDFTEKSSTVFVKFAVDNALDDLRTNLDIFTNNLKLSVSSLLKESVDDIFDEHFKLVDKFIALTSAQFEMFNSEFISKYKQRVNERNITNKWVSYDRDGNTRILNQNAFSPLSKKDIKHLFKTMENTSVLSTALSKDTELLEDLIHIGNSNIKTGIKDSLGFTVIKASNENSLGNTIETVLLNRQRQYLEAGASTLTSTVVAHETSAQVVAKEVLKIYDGVDGYLGKVKSVAEKMNQEALKSHLKHSVMDSLIHMYHRSGMQTLSQNTSIVPEFLNEFNSKIQNLFKLTRGTKYSLDNATVLYKNKSQGYPLSVYGLSKFIDKYNRQVTQVNTLEIPSELFAYIALVKGSIKTVNYPTDSEESALYSLLNEITNNPNVNKEIDYLREVSQVTEDNKIVVDITDPRNLYALVALKDMIESIKTSGINLQNLYQEAIDSLEQDAVEHSVVLAQYAALPKVIAQFTGVVNGTGFTGDKDILEVLSEDRVESLEDLKSFIDTNTKMQEIANKARKDKAKEFIDYKSSNSLSENNIKLAKELSGEDAIKQLKTFLNTLNLNSLQSKVYKYLAEKLSNNIKVFTDKGSYLDSLQERINNEENPAVKQAFLEEFNLIKSGSIEGIYNGHIGIYIKPNSLGKVSANTLLHELIHANLKDGLWNYFNNTGSEANKRLVKNIIDNVIKVSHSVLVNQKDLHQLEIEFNKDTSKALSVILGNGQSKLTQLATLVQFAFSNLPKQINNGVLSEKDLNIFQYQVLQEFLAYGLLDADVIKRMANVSSSKLSTKGFGAKLQKAWNALKKSVIEFLGLSKNKNSALVEITSELTALLDLQQTNKQNAPSLFKVGSLDISQDLGDSVNRTKVTNSLIDASSVTDSHKKHLKELHQTLTNELDKIIDKVSHNVPVTNYTKELGDFINGYAKKSDKDFIKGLRNLGIKMDLVEEQTFYTIKAISALNYKHLPYSTLKTFNNFINTYNSSNFKFKGQSFSNLFKDSLDFIALYHSNEEFNQYINTLNNNLENQNGKSLLSSYMKDILTNFDFTKYSSSDFNEMLNKIISINVNNFISDAVQQENILLNEQNALREKEKESEFINALSSKGKNITGILRGLFSGNDTITYNDNFEDIRKYNNESNFLTKLLEEITLHFTGGKQRPTILNSVKNWILGERKLTHYIGQAHTATIHRINQARQNAKAGWSVLMHRALDSYNISEESKEHLMSGLVQSSLFNYSEGSEFLDLLSNLKPTNVSKILKSKEKLLKSQLKSKFNMSDSQIEKVYNYLNWQTSGLAELQSMGTAKGLKDVHGILPNIRAISSLTQISHISKEILDVDKNLEVLSSLVQDLTILKSIQYLNQNQLDAIELLRTNAKNRIVDVTRNIKAVYENSRTHNPKSLIGRSGLFNKISNPNQDIKIVKRNSKEANHLETLGYRVVESRGDFDIYHTNQSLHKKYKVGMFFNTNTSIEGVDADNYNTLGVPSYTFYGKTLQALADDNDDLVEKAMRDPMFYSKLEKQSNIIARIDDKGSIIGFDYELEKDIIEKYIETPANTINNLASMAGRTVEEKLIIEENKNNFDKLNKDYSLASSEEKEKYFVKVDENFEIKGIKSNLDKVTQEKIRKFYHTLPAELKDYIDNHGGLYIRVYELDNIIGYHAFSMSDVFTGDSFLPEPVNLALKALFKGIGVVTGHSPVIVSKYLERALREFTSFSKNIILNKSIIVPIANGLSNAVHLAQWGISPKTIQESATKYLKLAKEYQQTQVKIAELQFTIQSLQNKDTVSRYRKSLDLLKKQLETNPVHLLVENGLLTSLNLAENVNEHDQFSLKTKLLDKTGTNSILTNLPNNISNLLILNGSDSYDFFTQFMDYGDFISKVILYEHLIKEGKTSTHALNIVREEFINYSYNRGALFDWLNDIGLTWFLSYKLGITKIIIRSFRKNWLRTGAIMATDLAISPYDPIGIYQTVPTQMLGIEHILPFGSYQTTPQWLDAWESHYLHRLFASIF